MPSRPLIGITLDHDDGQSRYELTYHYVESVASAGGVPMLLPFCESVDAAEQLEVIDGFVLAGGNDVDPRAWGESRHPAAKPVDPRREVHERGLLLEAERRELPVLAICFGMQVMNVARGGSLVQHLPDVAKRIEHRKGDQGWMRRHQVQIAQASLLADVCGTELLEVNTSHHQGIARLGDGLTVAAVAPDGTIEAVEDTTKPFWLGVQWHPERLAASELRHAALFQRLVNEADAARSTTPLRR